MAAERVDITIFGATGFLGKCVVEAFLLNDNTRELSWAIAGRNEEKLSQVLNWALKKTGQDVSGVPIIIAECNDQKSLDDMTKRTKVVINCCGPYSYYRKSVVKACIQNCTHYVDASYSKLICFAQKMVNKKEGEGLDRICGRKKSHDEVSDQPERRKKSTPVEIKSTKNTTGEELDHLDEQRIEENLGLDEFSSTYVKYWKLFAKVLLVVLVVFTIRYVFVSQLHEASDLSPKTEDNILEILIPLKSKFISQPKNLWVQIFTGFTNLIRSPASPAVYLLLSDRKSERTSSCVAEIITSVANKILPNNERWLFLNGSELSNAKGRDSGVLVEMIAKNMYYSRVLVVSDIDKIPGHLAAGFHFLVDQQNPKIRDAVYVFTMTVDEIGSRVKPLDAAEKTLFKSWSDLSANIINPLVTRVTEAVLHIVQEVKIDACPLKTRSTFEIRIP